MNDYQKKQVDLTIDDLIKVRPQLNRSEIENEVLDLTRDWNPVTDEEVLAHTRRKLNRLGFPNSN